MATLNKTRTTVKAIELEAEKITNYENATAFRYSDKERLITRVLGAFWNEDLFYASGGTIAEEIEKDIRTVAKVDPKFILQLAAYARNELFLRTTPQVLLVFAANIVETKSYVRAYAPKIVKRADELSEVIAFQLEKFGKPIPNSLKRGLADAFRNFDEYQLNKYDSNKSAVKLGDVLQLIDRHKDYPVSEAMRNYLVNDIIDEEALPKIASLKKLLKKSEIDDEALLLAKQSSVTWETFISHFGSTKEAWEIVAPNMGYMALLRNLRNFEQKNVEMGGILAIISDPDRVKKSKQLPFRFYSAYNTVTNQTSKRAISRAMEASITNATLEGKTAVMIDLSGSMGMGVSRGSTVTYKNISCLLGAIAARKSADSLVIGFATTAQEVRLNPDDTLLTNMAKIHSHSLNVGGGTSPHEAMKILGNRNVDRIIMLSDMQCYNPSDRYNNTFNTMWKEYRKNNPNVMLYSYDLSGYGTQPTPQTDKHVITLAGWNDKILDYINLAEKQDTMINQIAKW